MSDSPAPAAPAEAKVRISGTARARAARARALSGAAQEEPAASPTPIFGASTGFGGTGFGGFTGVTPPAADADGEDDEKPAEEDCKAEFKPLVQLEEVEANTGEEDEECLLELCASSAAEWGPQRAIARSPGQCPPSSLLVRPQRPARRALLPGHRVAVITRPRGLAEPQGPVPPLRCRTPRLHPHALPGSCAG